MPLERVRESITAIKNGEMVIIMDDEDREDEGDLVFAAEFCTPQKVNFMAQEARGLICVSITNKLAQKLDLQPMVAHNSSNHETAFTISIDSKDAKTGISAFERDQTIRLMCDESSTPETFVRPGHIFPLVAKEGGVLVRTGHTEASVDLCLLAGLKPVSVICEIMKKDGSMAHRGDKFLLEFASEHGLKILYVSDLIAYRLQFENLLTQKQSGKANFLGTECEKSVFVDHLGREHTVFVFGTLSQNALFKFHNIRSDLELLSCADAFENLMHSIELLKQQGGALVFLQTSSTKLSDIKNFGIGAQIMRALGMREFNLLTSTEGVQFVGLSGFGLNMKEKVLLPFEKNKKD